jgi:replicative DNA helicase
MDNPASTKRYKSNPPSSDTVKIPPHSIEAEQSVLGGLMLENRAWDNIADRVRENDFYRHDHRLIYRVMSKLSGTNRCRSPSRTKRTRQCWWRSLSI